MSRPSTSGVRNSEVERIIATAEVDTTFAGKKARYRGRRSVRLRAEEKAARRTMQDADRIGWFRLE